MIYEDSASGAGMNRPTTEQWAAGDRSSPGGV
jgi:hypothetical protein